VGRRFTGLARHVSRGLGISSVTSLVPFWASLLANIKCEGRWAAKSKRRALVVARGLDARLCHHNLPETWFDGTVKKRGTQPQAGHKRSKAVALVIAVLFHPRLFSKYRYIIPYAISSMSR
jgi:hypothetical protein